MDIAWSDLAAAFALYLVIEGLLPFASPARMRAAMAAFSSMTDGQLRTAGLLSIAAGLLMLLAVRG